MKTLGLIVILFWHSPAFCVPADVVKDRVVDPKEATRTVWQAEGVVSVYFVRNVFTSGERQLLWEAIQTWTQRARKSGREISFIPAGETGGLIDCVGCLTIARQGPSNQSTRQHVSFNSLRHDDAGRLISAWIGFEHQGTTGVNLRTLMLQALGRGLASNASQTAKGAR